MPKTTTEKDLGVHISVDLKSLVHIEAKANSRLGIITRNFMFIYNEIFYSLYTTLVRLILDYRAQCWSLHVLRNIKLLEWVQHGHGATRLVPALRECPYEERSEALKLPTLKDQRHRGDMIEVYKLFQ
ncbi:uncharacterized protein LOC143036284 [Oratosquilla oratoria]|uniref:uncharacterized protein LOC143036284 n=1 Tax=Oratosquilla oratoria TaxID=337810 RepID=UPI003F76D11E